MKLRQKTDVVAVANNLHKFVREEVRKNHSLPLDRDYYAMIYCCAPKKNVDVAKLPNGTIVVPFESVRGLLYPFGLNKLSVVVEEKYQESKC
eukprot:gene10084-11161_t